MQTQLGLVPSEAGMHNIRPAEAFNLALGGRGVSQSIT